MWENVDFDILIVDNAEAGGEVVSPHCLPCFFLVGILVVGLRGQRLAKA